MLVLLPQCSKRVSAEMIYVDLDPCLSPRLACAQQNWDQHLFGAFVNSIITVWTSNGAATMAGSQAADVGVSDAALQIELSKAGIPKAPFIEDVEGHLGGADEDAEPHLRKFQEAMSKYKMMELDRRQRQNALQDKIPDIEKTLAMVRQLKAKKVSFNYMWESKLRTDTHKSDRMPLRR